MGCIDIVSFLLMHCEQRILFTMSIYASITSINTIYVSISEYHLAFLNIVGGVVNCWLVRWIVLCLLKPSISYYDKALQPFSAISKGISREARKCSAFTWNCCFDLQYLPWYIFFQKKVVDYESMHNVLVYLTIPARVVEWSMMKVARKSVKFIQLQVEDDWRFVCAT